MAEGRFIVAQIGARHGYAVPAILEQAGLLERFYTDLCGDIGWGRQIARARCVPGLRGRLARLAGRRLPRAIWGKTRTFGWPAPCLARPADARRRRGLSRAAALQRRLGPGDGARRLWLRHARLLHARRTAPFLIEGSRRGLKVASEVYIMLSTERLLAMERREFPDWEPDLPDFAAIRREAMPEDVLITRSDHFDSPVARRAGRSDRHFGVRRAHRCAVRRPRVLARARAASCARADPARRRAQSAQGDPLLRDGRAALRRSGHGY